MAVALRLRGPRLDHDLGAGRHAALRLGVPGDPAPGLRDRPVRSDPVDRPCAEVSDQRSTVGQDPARLEPGERRPALPLTHRPRARVRRARRSRPGSGTS